MTQYFDLLPGVRLTAVQTEKFKTGFFSVNLLRPLDRGEAAKNALLPSVLSRGTARHPDMRSIGAVSEELYGCDIGGAVRKKGEVQIVSLYADFIEDQLVGEPVFSRTLDMLAELLLEPKLEKDGFSRDYVHQEKENLKNAMEGRLNSKRAYAVSQLIKAMFAEEAFGTDKLGEPEDLPALDARGLYTHYCRILAQSPVELFYAGSMEGCRVAELAAERFRAMPRQTEACPGTVFVPRAAQVRRVEECLRVTQGKLAMGFRAGVSVADPRWPATVVMNTVFGGGVTSKLFLNVREKRSLCYYVSSSLEKYKGVLIVSSGIDCSAAAAAEEGILEQLEACRTGNITEEELTTAKKQLVSGLKTTEDSPAKLEEFYLGQVLSGRTGDPSGLIRGLEAVDAAGIAEAADRVSLDTVYFLKGAEA